MTTLHDTPRYTFAQLWGAFSSHAAERGYTKKIVGDYGYYHKRNRNKIIRLIYAPYSGPLTIFETGHGRYKMNMVEEITDNRTKRRTP